MINMIRVWPFRDAPRKYRKMSDNGGDEDWVVVVPARYARDWIPWIDHTDTCREPQRIEQKDGSVVYIGSHA